MSLPIRKAIEAVDDGAVRIPAFQRGFVWDAERVAYLMDSIFKGYPFGTLILWQTKERLSYERNLGPFSLSEPKVDYPVEYVLDGQQRLTSIYGVFQSSVKLENPPDWTQIYFDLAATSDHQETQFFALSADDVVPGRHFPIGTFFDSIAYRKATQPFSDEQVAQIDSVQSVFKEAMLPVQQIVTEDRAKVAIVFERVNRMGVELDIFQLLSAWTWSDDFDLQSQFAELAEDLEPYGFGDVGEENNLLLRACAAVVKQDTSPDTIINLNGSEVRERFQEVLNGLRGAIDFLRTNLQVEHLSNLPYYSLLVPLAVFFARPGNESVRYTDSQREVLLRWFWCSCFSRRFSAGVIRNLNRDIVEAANLRDGNESKLSNVPAMIYPAHFATTTFSIRNVNTRTFVLMLAQWSPRSFVSGAPISLKNVLQSYNQNEFHHLFPKAFMRGKHEPYPVSALANFAFVSSQDNKILGGVAPSIYRSRMSKKNEGDILSSALSPGSLFNDAFTDFIRERSMLLCRAALFLMTGQDFKVGWDNVVQIGPAEDNLHNVEELYRNLGER